MEHCAGWSAWAAQPWLLVVAALYVLRRLAHWCLDGLLLRDSPIRWEPDPRDERHAHDRRRHASYPPPVSNTWYMLCDSDQLAGGKVLEVRALGRTFASAWIVRGDTSRRRRG